MTVEFKPKIHYHIAGVYIDTMFDKTKRNQYWQSLYAIRQEYLAEHKGQFDLTARPSLHYWAEQKYGFEMKTDGQGNYTEDYTVTDPKKFMLCQIKYWK